MCLPDRPWRSSSHVRGDDRVACIGKQSWLWLFSCLLFSILLVVWAWSWYSRRGQGCSWWGSRWCGSTRICTWINWWLQFLPAFSIPTWLSIFQLSSPWFSSWYRYRWGYRPWIITFPISWRWRTKNKRNYKLILILYKFNVRNIRRYCLIKFDIL